MNIILLCCLLLSVIDWVNTQTIHNEIAILDCNGDFHVLPNSQAFSTRFSTGDMLGFYNFITDKILFPRIQCACPSITAEEFNRRFAIHTWDYWLQILTGTDDNYSECAASAPGWDQNFNLTKDIKVKMDLKSCTYANWIEQKDCLLKFPLPLLGMELQLAIGHCPSSHFPFLSLTCKGAACDTIGLPCNNNGECAPEQTCYNLGNSTDGDIFDAFVDAYLYDSGDTSPGCYAPSYLLKNIFDEVRSQAYGKDKSFTFPRIPILDFSLCAYKFDKDPGFGCTSNTTDSKNNTVLECTGLQDWDGILYDGSSATSASRLQGSIPGALTFDTIPNTLISSGAVPLFYHSCDNDVLSFPQGAYGLSLSNLFTSYSTFFDNVQKGGNNLTTSFMISSYALDSIFALSKIKFKFPILNKVVDIWYGDNFDWQTCRAKNRGRTLTEAEYKLRYGWMLPYGISLLTFPHQSFMNTMSDWYSSLISNSDITLHSFLAPSTCTYDYYTQNYQCALSFTGLQSLLKPSDLTLNLLIKDCPGYHVPAFYMECQGNDCALLKQPLPCTTDSDCTNYPGTKCLSMDNTKSLDFVQAFFTHKYYPIDSCGSTSSLLNNLKSLVTQYLNGGTAQTSLCFWDLDTIIKNTNYTKWAEDQYVVTGDQFTISGLTSWEPKNTDIPGSGPTAPGTSPSGTSPNGPHSPSAPGSNSSSLISYSWIPFLLVLMIWI